MTISLYTKTTSSSAFVTDTSLPETSSTTNTRPDPDEKSTSAGIFVDLSPLVKELTSASEKGESSLLSKKEKIDESDLPSELKDILKRIVEYREKLKEKQQELQSIKNDSSLSEEERKTQIEALQQEINIYSNSLHQAMIQLSDTVNQMGLDNKAVAEVMSHVMS